MKNLDEEQVPFWPQRKIWQEMEMEMEMELHLDARWLAWAEIDLAGRQANIIGKSANEISPLSWMKR